MLKTLHFNGPHSVCKVCGGSAAIYGIADFNKSCTPADLPPLGISVHYHQCENCGLIFSNACDAWTTADFQEYIYNDDYIKIDPGSLYERPRQSADVVLDFIKRGTGLR